MWKTIKEHLKRPEIWAAIVLGGLVGELARQAGYTFIGSIAWLIAIVAVTSVMWYYPIYRKAIEEVKNG